MGAVSSATRRKAWALRLLIGGLLPSMCGCAGLDAAERARLWPVGTSGFIYDVTTDLFYGPRADGPAEAARLSWLPELLNAYALCPRGYELTSREVIFLYESPRGEPVDNIRYKGRCRG